MRLVQKIRDFNDKTGHKYDKFFAFLIAAFFCLSSFGSWLLFMMALLFIKGDPKWICMIVSMFTFMPTFIFILFSMPNKEKISRFWFFTPFVLTYGLVLAMFFSILYGNGQAAILEGVGAAFLSAFCWGAYRDANPKDYGSLPWL